MAVTCIPLKSGALAGLLLPALLGAADSGERAVFTMQTGIVRDEPAAGRFHLDGKTRQVPPTALSTRRGTAVIRLVVHKEVSSYPCHFEFWPGPPAMKFNVAVAWHKDAAKKEDRTMLDCHPTVTLRHDYTNNPSEQIKPDKPLVVKPGTELHLVWTWSGVQHRLYCNGALLHDYIATSPFPPQFAQEVRALSNMTDEVLQGNPVKELSLYNFAFTAEEVQRDLARQGTETLVPHAPHAATVAAQWGPSERKVYTASDAGSHSEHVENCRFTALTRSGTILASAEVSSSQGFAAQLMPLPEVTAGSYLVRAEWLDAKARVIATATSATWECTESEWLGNTIGLNQGVQPPWTPVKERGGDLEVWGRSYTVTGGYGLPQQIVSQGREQLAAPVTLTFIQDGRELLIHEGTSHITSLEPHEGRWTGSASAGGVRIAVRGSLAYDGMALVRLRLSPESGEQPVRLDGITLDMRMPKERALFLNTSTDQGYWWYPYKGRIPEAPGLVLNNLKQQPGKTNFLFYALFSDHDTGLEWFADNLAGWQVNESKPVQEIIREPDGTVLLRCHLANQSFNLDRPVEITFGYDATPVKPLPEDWRLTYCHHHRIPQLDQHRAVWWLWEHASYQKFRPHLFSTVPLDPAGYAKAIGGPNRPLMVPFTNQHVLVPSGRDTKSDRGWEWFINLVGAETENTGWDSVPSRVARDYWAYHFDQFLREGGISGIYMDEAGTATVGSSLLSGAGWKRADGTHAFGHNTLGMRLQFQRIRQVFLDQGKRPLIWIPVYGKIIPHAHAFADIVSEGESFMFEKPEDPDFIDLWANEDGSGPKEWLLSLGPAQKFGFSTLFLDYHRFHQHSRYLPALRSMYGLLGLLDITPINPEHTWYFKVRQDFGMSEPETTFHRYFEQAAIRSSVAEVKVSYHHRKDRVLAVVTNCGKKDASPRLTFDFAALGLNPDRAKVTRLDAARVEKFCSDIARKPLPWQERRSITLHVPKHDFCLLWLEDSPGKPVTPSK